LAVNRQNACKKPYLTEPWVHKVQKDTFTDHVRELFQKNVPGTEQNRTKFIKHTGSQMAK